MKVFLATDHAGFQLKEKVKAFLIQKQIEVEDCGAHEFNRDDDYPDFIAKAAREVSNDPENSRGIIFGSSGQGEAIVANKFKNVRCALFYAPVVPAYNVDVSGRTSQNPFEMISLTREHNNANMLSLGAKILTEADALKAVELWLNTPYANEERHARRIEKIKEIENQNYV